MGKAESAAVRLRQETGTADVADVDLDLLARHLGAEIIYDRLGTDVSGMLLREEDRIVVGVNEKHAPTRQRFTIAHEFGHLVLHRGRPLVVDQGRINLRDRRSSLATDIEEIEANSFAAELLMPATAVLREFRIQADQGGQDLAGIKRDLAQVFAVSDQAMEYRLANLGLLRPT
jgi:Zn-dependent peptidase ImmA (M78 family)